MRVSGTTGGVPQTLENVARELRGQISQFQDVLGEATQSGRSEMLYYLKLQQQMLSEQRAFQALSNIMKARHDSAINAIRNFR